MKITIGTLAAGLIGFKGASYSADAWNPVVYAGNAGNDQDWSGLYIAAEESTAQGYLPDAVGNGCAYIHQVSLTRNVDMITCLDESFKTGNINMGSLKEALRENSIPVGNDELLMPRLGKLGYVFRCYNSEEGAIEIIVPNSMLDRIQMYKYKMCEMKNYAVLYCKSC
jgi:hypothetical protein